MRVIENHPYCRRRLQVSNTTLLRIEYVRAQFATIQGEVAVPKQNPKSASAIMNALNASDLVYYGTLKSIDSDDQHLLFRPFGGADEWTRIPTRIITGAERVGQSSGAEGDYHLVKLSVSRPESSESLAYLNLPTSTVASLSATSLGIPSFTTGGPTRKCYDSVNKVWYDC